MTSAASSQDVLRATIDRAIREAIAGVLSADDAVAVVIEARIERDVVMTPTERIAAESARLLAMFDQFGADRDAAAKVARTCTNCAHERERIAQRVRALARRRKKNEASSFHRSKVK